MRNYLKTHRRLLSVGAFSVLFSLGGQAQVLPSATDSIPILQLLEQVERHTGQYCCPKENVNQVAYYLFFSIL